MLTCKSQFFAVLLVILSPVLSIRVCNNILSYDNPLSKDCWNNPDGERDANQIIKSWNFTTTEYFVQTKDGYIISVLRAFNANFNNTLKKTSPLVFGVGFFTNANFWVAKGTKSLHYQLGIQGYETWTITWRGGKQSKRHVNLSSTDSRFWDFSFYEMGMRDLAAILEKVHNVTGEKCIFIGHSIGASAAFTLASENPDYFKTYVKNIVALAPIAYIGNLTGSVRLLIKTFPILQALVDLTSHGEFLPILATNTLHDLVAPSGTLMFALQLAFYTAFGFDLDELDAAALPILTSITHDSAAMKNVVHVGQLAETGKFRQYDYGLTRNLIHYGRSKPPSINITKISVPTTFFAAQNDFAVRLKDVRRTYADLQPSIRCGLNIIANPKFNHVDYVEARNTDIWLNNYLIAVLNGLEDGVCLSN